MPVSIVSHWSFPVSDNHNEGSHRADSRNTVLGVHMIEIDSLLLEAEDETSKRHRNETGNSTGYGHGLSSVELVE